MKKHKVKKGFTLIELIVVIAVLGILVLLAAPRMLGYTDKAKVAELTNNNKVIETASQMYHMDNDDWPRLTDDPYTADEVDAFAEKIYHLTGEEVELDPDGNYYDIDFDKLSEHVKIPGDPANYVLQNPVGKVYALYNPTESAKDRLPSSPASGEEAAGGIYTEEEIEKLIDVQKYTEISTAEELDAVRNGMTESHKYIQTKDIDLSGYSAADGNGWEPIGNSTAKFSGTYDGGGFKITGLTINRPNQDYVGLFGYINGATIKNAGIKDVKATGRSGVGGLVGLNYNRSTVSDSYSTGAVTGTGNFVGGLAGYNYNSSTVSNSYSTGDVSGNSSVGGLVGWNYINSTVSDSYSTGNVNGRDSVGGLVGWNESSTISDSYSTGTVSSTGDYVGGLVGKNSRSTVSNSYYDTQTSGLTTSAGGTGKTTAEMKKQSTYSGWKSDKIWKIEEGEYPTLRKTK